MSAPTPAPVRVAVTLEQCWHRVPGGTASAALEIVRALGETPAATAQLQLIGVSGFHRQTPEPAFSPSIAVHPLGSRLVPLAGPTLYEAWHRLRRPAVQRATGPVDVIWATGIAMPPKSAPIVLTLHDLAFRHDPDNFTRHGVRFFEAALELARRDADLVLCSSEATRADCVAAGLAPERLRVVPLGVRPSRFTGWPAERVASAVDDARQRFGIAGPYVVAVGTVEPRKNLRRLLAAFASIAGNVEHDLVVVGPEGWHEDFAAAIPPAIASRVRRTGFVSDGDKAALLRGAAALAYPSTWEGFGLPVLEAMAERTPVVTSAGTATEEAAGGAALLVDPLDVDAMARGIASVLSDEALATRLRDAGTRRAAELTWERTAGLVGEALVEAAGGDGRR